MPIPNLTLLPLTKEDISTGASICGASMATDRHTMLKAAHPTKPYDHGAGMVGAFDYWLGLPKEDAEVIKAVDENGEMLGLVVWYKSLDPEEKRKWDDEEKPAQEEAAKGEGEVAKVEKTPREPLEELEEITSTHLAEYQKRIMPRGVKTLVIGTLAVKPSAQGRGVGSALIGYGTRIADENGAICWVHSSDGAEGAYAKAGFVVDDVLEIDLDEWADKARIDKGDGFGRYRFRYMVRQPMS